MPSQNQEPLHVGFYYHVEGTFAPGSPVRVPSVIGLFVSELARQAGAVTFYLHEAEPTHLHDYALDDSRVRAVNLGPRRRAPVLSLFPHLTLRSFRPQQDGLDIMLIRGPTPLLPALRKASEGVPVALQLVGDLTNWTPQRFFSAWRNRLVRAWVRYYSFKQDRAANGTIVLLKSAALRDRRGRTYRNSVVLFTSTLLDETVRVPDAARSEWSPSKGRSESLRLLYTGRIVKDKGLFEAIEAVALLRDQGWRCELQIVGWSDPRDPTHKDLLLHAERLGVRDQIVLGGYKSAGPELMSVYEDADIYVFPTYAEGGVSRAVIEAMAAGLPVVATQIPSVEGLLVDEKNALLIERQSAPALAAAVRRLLEDAELRKGIAIRGHAWAKGLTLGRSCALLLERLREWKGSAREV